VPPRLDEASACLLGLWRHVLRVACQILPPLIDGFVLKFLGGGTLKKKKKSNKIKKIKIFKKIKNREF
jgi:hypothetical protein